MTQRKFLNSFLIVLVIITCIQIQLIQAKTTEAESTSTNKLTSVSSTGKVNKQKKLNCTALKQHF